MLRGQQAWAKPSCSLEGLHMHCTACAWLNYAFSLHRGNEMSQMLQHSAHRSYGVQTWNGWSTSEKAENDVRTHQPVIRYSLRLYSWTVQTGVSVLWPILRVEYTFCTIFLSANNPQMSMICKTADQFKLVGYRFVCQLQAAPLIDNYIATSCEKCSWNSDIQVAASKSIKLMNFLALYLVKNPLFWLFGLFRFLRSWCPRCLCVTCVFATFDLTSRASCRWSTRYWRPTHGCGPRLNPFPGLNSWGRKCKKHKYICMQATCMNDDS